MIDIATYDRTPSKYAEHRHKRAEELVETLGVVRNAIGISRVADITRLDRIGLPVMQAIRPQATTLKVSGGKGLTAPEAVASCVLESLELWCSERVPTERWETVMQMPLGYDISDLPMEEGASLPGAEVPWVKATPIHTRAVEWVPWSTVRLDFRAPTTWADASFFVSSTGLGCGGTIAEATLQGLFEIVERDAVSRMVNPRAGRRAKASLFPRNGGERLHQIEGLLEASNVKWIVEKYPSLTDLPVCGAAVWSDDYGVIGRGTGCHLDGSIAAERALTEAIQARTTHMAGAREDIDEHDYQGGPTAMLSRFAATSSDTEPLGAQPSASWSVAEAIEAVTGAIRRAGWSEPLVVELTPPPVVSLKVARVIVPGASMVQEAI